MVISVVLNELVREVCALIIIHDPPINAMHSSPIATDLHFIMGLQSRAPSVATLRYVATLGARFARIEFITT